MSSVLTSTHPFFAISHERARSYIKWGRRLAQAEGIILLIGSCAMLPSVASTLSTNPLALVVAAMGVLSLTLGWYVGRGSAVAAVILLGLSISRAAMVLVPGAPDAWTTMPLFALVELFVFGQAARGAIALSNPDTHDIPEAPIIPSVVQPLPVARPLDPSVKWPVPWVEVSDTAPTSSISSILSRANPFAVDLFVAAVVVALGVFAMTRPIPHSEGLQGWGETLVAAIGFLNLAPAIMLAVSGNEARKGKVWGRRVRLGVYAFFASEALIWFQFAVLLRTH